MEASSPNTSNSKYETAYAEGYKSRYTKDCPYKKGTDEYKAWHVGITQYYSEQNSIDFYVNAHYNSF